MTDGDRPRRVRFPRGAAGEREGSERGAERDGARTGHAGIIARGRRALLATALALGAGALAPAPGALADGDPASDVLLLQNVYYPYHPAIAPRLHAQLDDLTKRAKDAGFPIKVAIIAAPADLGVVPEFFGRPQRYARFLEPEIVYNRPQPLLTVMPNGYGTEATGPRGEALVAALPRPAAGADGMARGALRAVVQLAAANGHALDASGLGAKARPPRGGTPLALVFAPLALVALAALALSARQRRRRGGPAADG